MTRVPAPESRKKAQASSAKACVQAKKGSAEAVEAKCAKRREIMAKAVKYNREYAAAAAAVRCMRATADMHGNHFSEPEPKVLFVVRIRGINDVAPKPRKILQLLRLRQLHTGVFLQVNKATLSMLNRVEPYIAWGYPSRSTVSKLIYKRGYANVKGNRIPLCDNAVVEEAFAGKTNQAVTCTEDLVHQLFTSGEHFSAVAHGLWPFKLSTPNGGLKYKNSHFVEGGDFGNRETLVNSFLSRMI
ncbi:60S ribosomal protein L7-2 [Diplonema papillatum]|nr:60S ribosomal protein L7-2 [Diplonema papillatum]